MLNQDVSNKVKEIIKDVAAMQKIELPELKDKMEIVDDLGFKSLTIAALIAHLEEVFGVDPFEDDDVMITDVRTIKDVCEVYSNCLEKVRS